MTKGDKFDLPIPDLQLDELDIIRTGERLFGMIYAFDFTRDSTDDHFQDCQEQCMTALSEWADTFFTDADHDEFYEFSLRATQVEIAEWLLERGLKRIGEGLI